MGLVAQYAGYQDSPRAARDLVGVVGMNTITDATNSSGYLYVEPPCTLTDAEIAHLEGWL